MKNKRDERQILELLQIEHVGFWVMFWSALALIIVKITFLKMEIKDIIGECVLIFLGGLVILVGSAKKGAWDGQSEPEIKSSVIAAVVGGVLSAAAYTVIRAVRSSETPGNLALQFVIVLAAVFAVLLTFFAVYTKVIKKKRIKLADDLDE